MFRTLKLPGTWHQTDDYDDDYCRLLIYQYLDTFRLCNRRLVSLMEEQYERRRQRKGATSMRATDQCIMALGGLSYIYRATARHTVVRTTTSGTHDARAR